MRQPTLSGIVGRRFVHCVNQHGQTAREVVQTIGVSPGELCQIIAGCQVASFPLQTYDRIARWLQMPLANVIALAESKPRLQHLIEFGMNTQGYLPSNTRDQIQASAKAGISVAVFRRALHGYADFRPSIHTCDRLAHWLAWSGFTPDDIVTAAGMTVRYLPSGRRVSVSADAADRLEPYPCACGRAGCMVPAHIPSGPRRKWRSDACRMWAKRQIQRAAKVSGPKSRHVRTPLYHSPIERFITINERLVPVRS